jgi:hypothetical protein
VTRRLRHRPPLLGRTALRALGACVSWVKFASTAGRRFKQPSSSSCTSRLAPSALSIGELVDNKPFARAHEDLLISAPGGEVSQARVLASIATARTNVRIWRIPSVSRPKGKGSKGRSSPRRSARAGNGALRHYELGFVADFRRNGRRERN